jgi:hypothetical protein
VGAEVEALLGTGLSTANAPMSIMKNKAETEIAFIIYLK